MRVKNSTEFFQKLHELEEDPLWWEHIGDEDALNHYMSTGSLDISHEDVKKERQLLRELRDNLGISEQAWTNSAQRDGLRLWVTMYRNYGLTYDQIAEVLNIPASTIRTNYRELKPFEMLTSDYAVYRRDHAGRIISHRPHRLTNY